METHATHVEPPSVAASHSVTPPSAAEESAPVETGATDAPVQMIAVRRRSRRGRRRSRMERMETPQRRNYLIMLCVVVLLVSVALVKPLRDSVNGVIASAAPALRHMGISLEVIALVFAGLILLYLMPGVEERVLRLFGIKTDKKRR